MKSHYDTLGVPKTATRDEIKAAFRKLCMETHPDVATNKIGNIEKFKQVSEAHAILSGERSRRRYDFEVEEAMKLGRAARGGFQSKNDGSFVGNRYAAGRAGQPPFALSVLDGIFYRPRNLFLGVTIGFATLALAKSTFSEDDRSSMRKTGMKNLVEAWKNPATGEWEQPAPWDATYIKQRPTLHLMPRENVRQRRR